MRTVSFALLCLWCHWACGNTLDLGETTVLKGANSRVFAESYEGGILRLKIAPYNVDEFYKEAPYEVNDVVVGKPLPNAVTKMENDKLYVFNGKSIVMLDTSTGVIAFWDDMELVASAQIKTDNHKPEATFRFPHAKKFYGIPERAVDLALKENENYRLWNLDVFQYKLDASGGIYGTIPFLMAHGANRTSGILWLNSADTTVSILPANADGAGCKWSSESGIYDIFFFPGKTPMDVQRQHASITGPTMLPPLFSLGYHQCRWNYRSQQDSLEVDEGFDKHNIPYDVLWLDIEHTDGKKYFTWDTFNFPEPDVMIRKIAAKGRKVVTITDPHIKREAGYYVHDQATEKRFYVQTEGGSDFEGHCWPGTSSWVDFYNKDARDWYATLFKYDVYKYSSRDLYTWIDMNEPSVFNAHEVTMDKNLVHRSASGKRVLHRDVHNMYGYYHTMAAHAGHMLRNEDSPTRPFILTRSFFSGSQRYAAMWTGDNMAEWSHLQKSLPMLMTLSLSNYAFVGADVGGFFNNPTMELLVRWYQAGAFYPFFRGHAHLETKRREHWLFGETATKLIRRSILLRYQLIPYLYTQFYRAHRDGGLVLRPLFFEWPTDTTIFEEQASIMFGDAILARPVTEAMVNTVVVKFPASPLEKWYHFFSGDAVETGATSITMPVSMETIPVFQRGGTIVPMRMRQRRCTSRMLDDPVTLTVALSHSHNATGQLYMDDSHSFNYQRGGFVLRQFTFENDRLYSREAPPALPRNYHTTSVIDKIVIYGVAHVPKKIVATTQQVTVEGARMELVSDLEFTISGHTVTIKQPKLPVDSDWSIALQQ